MKEYLHILRNRDFLLLWVGQGVSALGSRIHYIALIWLVTEITGNAAGIGLLFMFMAVPRILVFPIAGVLVERWNKRNVIVVCDILSGLTAIGVALTNDLPAIYVLSTISVLISLFFSPAVQSAVPRIVPKAELLTANSLTSMTRQVASLGGPALGGMIIGLWGLKTAFLVNGVSFLISALSEMFIHIPRATHESEVRQASSILKDLKEGWEYIRQHPAVKLTILFFALAGLPMGAIIVLKVVFLKDVLSLTAAQYGLVMTIEGIGLFLGTFAIGKWGGKWYEVTAMVIGCAVIGAAYVGLSLVNTLWLAAACVSAVGLAGAIVNITYGTLLQKAVDDHVRSRVYSFDMAIGEVLALASMGAAGFLGDTFGITKTIMVCGLLIIVLCLGTLRIPLYRQIQQSKELAAD